MNESETKSEQENDDSIGSGDSFSEQKVNESETKSERLKYALKGGIKMVKLHATNSPQSNKNGSIFNDTG